MNENEAARREVVAPKEVSSNSLSEEFIIYRTPIAYGPHLLLFAVLTAFGLYSVFELPWSLLEIDLGAFVLVFPILALPAILVGTYILHSLYDAKYIITEEYIRCIEGILSFQREDDFLEHRHMSSIEVENSVCGRLFNTGSVCISYLGDRRNIKLSNIAGPFQVRKTILDFKSRLNERSGPLGEPHTSLSRAV